MKKIRIIYTSESTQSFSKRELLNLLHDSRTYNSIDGIYGFLFYKKGTFLQVIEGETEEVNNLFSRIEKDPRHTNLNIFFKERIHDYLFSNWSMGCTIFNNPELSFIPGISVELNNKDNITLLVSKLPQLSSFLLEHPELHFC